MESKSAVIDEVADGAEAFADSGVSEDPDASNTLDDQSEAVVDDDAVSNGAPTSSGLINTESNEELGAVSESGGGNEEGEEMDIDDTAVGGTADASAYIGDNCISTPAATGENSPQETQGMLDLGPKEESPDQSISSAMPIDSAAGDDAPMVQDDESSTMDEDMGGGEGVASSDDVNDISSAAQESINTGISSSTAEGGGDITSSGQTETPLISSTANGPAALHSFSLPKEQQSSEFGDADTSEMDSGADTMPSVSDPLLAISTNGSGMLSPSLLPEESGIGVSSSVPMPRLVKEEKQEDGAAGDGDGAAGDGDGAVSSSGAAPLPPADAAHALATLASAALHHQEQTEPDEKPVIDEETWYTVGIIRGTSFTVQNYISDPNVDISNISMDNLPDLNSLPTSALEHGTAYKFRVAAINSCGVGDFSEESAFKTCLPGFPGAPSAIKISKSAEGAHLSWEPPQVAAEGIFEYSVYLAVRSNTPTKETAKSQLAFVRVYCGKTNTCIVPQSSLSAAHVDSSTKPAIIFRIAARNDKGYGPATQVRWLQDIKSTGVKRAGENRLPGASPSKQVKQTL